MAKAGEVTKARIQQISFFGNAPPTSGTLQLWFRMPDNKESNVCNGTRDFSLQVPNHGIQANSAQKVAKAASLAITAYMIQAEVDLIKYECSADAKILPWITSITFCGETVEFEAPKEDPTRCA